MDKENMVQHGGMLFGLEKGEEMLIHYTTRGKLEDMCWIKQARSERANNVWYTSDLGCSGKTSNKRTHDSRVKRLIFLFPGVKSHEGKLFTAAGNFLGFIPR